MGWTRKSAAVSVLLVLEEHRKQAGARLTALLAERGWTHEDLAHASGLSVKTISRFANGRHEARGGTVRALAQALKVPEQAITGPPPPPLGLGADAPTVVDGDQLDRVEAKLDLVLRLLGAESEPASLPEIAAGIAEAVPQRSGRGRRESGTAGRAKEKKSASG